MVSAKTPVRPCSCVGPERMLPMRRERPPVRTRMEWNGVAGLRQVRIQPGAREPGQRADRCERLVGEVSEPMS